ncbi:MAG: ABC transporter permease [Acetobacteraceae bacterium]|nr:ABC transporter permease [Acetobacteraceae bacterium]
MAAIGAPLLARQNPSDLAGLDLMNSFIPPVFAGGLWSFPLGTDDQGRDILSSILWGTRISLGVGCLATALSTGIGLTAGLAAGYFGRVTDAVLMRFADMQLTFPALLVALLVDGLLRTALPRGAQDATAFAVLVFSIGISNWPHFARMARAAARIEAEKEYVLAARLVGRSAPAILTAHILPNLSGTVLVLATTNLAAAMIAEATLSFLGISFSPAQPSLGTLVRFGSAFLFSGEWWLTVVPGAALVLLVWCVNRLGDWMGDALNPRLR